MGSLGFTGGFGDGSPVGSSALGPIAILGTPIRNRLADDHRLPAIDAARDGFAALALAFASALGSRVAFSVLTVPA